MRPDQSNGLWIPDNFLATVRGYNRLERLARDSTVGFHSEIESISNGLFPIRDVPVASRPGYVTHERDYFIIEHPDQDLKKHLEEYLLGRFHRGDLFGHAYNLAGFFEMAATTLLTEGKTFYRIEWGDEDVGGVTYKLPTDFMYLPGVTMRKTKKGYMQRYSLYTYFFDKSFRNPYEGERKKYPRTYRFGFDEILKFEYFEKTSPLVRSLKYVTVFEKFWQFGLNQSRGGAEPENRLLSIEKTRYTRFSREKRKYDLAKSKVAKIFNYIPTGTGKDFTLTEYYDIYTATRYVKSLTQLRNKLVNDFNEQVLSQIAIKNQLAETPRLQMRYLPTEDQIDQIFSQYSSGQIDNHECIKLLLGKT